MSLIFVNEYNNGTRIGVWQMDNNTKMYDVCPVEVCNKLEKVCKTRQDETIAVYALLNKMINRRVIVCHEESGRPYLSYIDKQEGGKESCNINISISHTRGYAAIILSNDDNAAIDMEYIDPRVLRITSKFLKKEELNEIQLYGDINTANDKIKDNRLIKALLYWCAKETIFKYYSDSRLTFEDIKVGPVFLDDKKNEFYSYNLINNERIKINYIINEKFIITFAL